MRTKTGKTKMTGKKTRNGPTAGSGQTAKDGTQPLGNALDRLSLVREMILERIAKGRSKDGQRSGVTDLIRLLALEKELSESEQTTQEIKVTWVEPDTA